ncbi:MAG: hypothetical protein ABSB80_12340 [Methanoregula sp.]|jgi:hypothetical protein
MDLNLIENFAAAIGTIAMAIGTLALAYFSYKNIRQSNKQLKFLKEELNLFLLQQQPDIQISQCSFEGNKLNLRLHNSGNGCAYDIAILSSFSVVKPLYPQRSLWGLREHLISPEISELRVPQLIEAIRNRRNLLFNILSKPKDKNILKVGELIIFLRNDEFSNSLPAGYSRNFQCEPIFNLKTKNTLWNKISQDMTYLSEGIKFNDLRTLLLKNNIKEISVIFHLFSKDKLQNPLSHGRICDFVIILLDDENLEVAYKRGRRGPYPIDRTEIKTILNWLDPHDYLYGKYIGFDDVEKEDSVAWGGLIRLK